MPLNKNKVSDGNMKLNPNISVDCVVFGFDGKEIHVLLIDRENQLKNVKSAYKRQLVQHKHLYICYNNTDLL